MPQAAPMVGPDGTIYAHKVGDNVTAIRDSGDSLHVLWIHPISGDGEQFSAFSHFAVGPDSTVYVASDGRIQRLDPATGNVIDSSEVVQDPSGVLFNVRLAIGSDGTVYLVTGQDNGGLYAFTPDLQTLWLEAAPNVNTSGPAIGPGGVLAFAGAGTTLKVYAGGSAVVEQRRPTVGGSRLTAFPNPCRGSVVIHLLGTRSELKNNSVVPLRLYNAAGRLVLQSATSNLQSEVALDLRSLPPGTYVCRAGDQQVRLLKVD
jgi:outer membrane protein assembly factor BamB